MVYKLMNESGSLEYVDKTTGEWRNLYKGTIAITADGVNDWLEFNTDEDAMEYFNITGSYKEDKSSENTN